MIKLSNSSVTILLPDGTKHPFDSDELQAGIIKSCLAAGIRESWIAEDIALSIEFALNQTENSDKVFTLSEVNSLVIKILEETGYPEVAENFKIDNSSTEIEIDANKQIIGDLIRKHLALNGDDLDVLVKKVKAACETLSIKSASPSLFLEFAKLYKNRRLSIDDMKVPRITRVDGQVPWDVSSKDIYSRVQPRTYELVEAEVLRVAGISRLFPAIKIDFRINKLVEMLKLETPLTEMAVLPYFGSIGKAVDNLFSNADELYRETAKSKNKKIEMDLPFYLNVPDMSLFARNCLQTAWPESKAYCHDMISFLERAMECEVFKLTLH